MEDWNEEFLAVEVEREIEKHNAERESLDLTNTNLGCARILFGLFLGIVGLVIIVLFFL